jgi:hypothetical protein
MQQIRNSGTVQLCGKYGCASKTLIDDFRARYHVGSASERPIPKTIFGTLFRNEDTEYCCEDRNLCEAPSFAREPIDGSFCIVPHLYHEILLFYELNQ